jgi:hypothetical protein
MKSVVRLTVAVLNVVAPFNMAFVSQSKQFTSSVCLGGGVRGSNLYLGQGILTEGEGSVAIQLTSLLR